MSTTSFAQEVYFCKSPHIMYDYPMTDETFGVDITALRWAMKKKKWKDARLSKESGVNKATISRLFQHEVKEITAISVVKMARALEVSADFLMGLTGNPEPKPAMDMAIGEILDIAKTLSKFRQRDLLLIAQLYKDNDVSLPDPEQMEFVFKTIEKIGGSDMRAQVSAALHAARAAQVSVPPTTRPRRRSQKRDEEVQGK